VGKKYQTCIVCAREQSLSSTH